MRNNRPMKQNGERFRVITFDNDQTKQRSSSLIGYLNSVKTWFKDSAGPSTTKKDAVTTATFSKGVQKSRSGSALAIRSISSSILKGYTRSRTLSLEDLKRTFKKKNSPLGKSQSSKKKSSRTKVKNGTEHRNIWDRDIQVLYSYDTNKFTRKLPQHKFAKNSEIITSSLESSVDKGLSAKTWNCGRKECKSPNPNHAVLLCDYRSRNCRDKRACPYNFERSPRETETCQQYDAKVFADRASSIVTDLLCCPCGRQAHRKTDHNTHTVNKVWAYCDPRRQAVRLKPNHANPQSYKNTLCSCFKRRPYHQTCNNLFTQRKGAGPTFVNTQIQSSNNLAKCCFSVPKERFTSRNKAGPTTDYIIVQSSNTMPNKCCYCKPKEGSTPGREACPTSEYTNVQSPNEMPRCCTSKRKEGFTQENVQSNNNVRKCCCCKLREGGLKTDHDNTYIYKPNYNCPACGLPTRKEVGVKTDQAAIHTSTKLYKLCSCPMRQRADKKYTDYAITQTSSNSTSCDFCRQQTQLKTDYAITQTSNNICMCNELPRKDVVDNQTSFNMFTCCFPSRSRRGPKFYDTSTQTSKNKLCTCCYARQMADRPVYLNAKKKKKFRCYCLFKNKSRSPKKRHKKSQTYFSKLKKRNFYKQNRHTRCQNVRTRAKCTSTSLSLGPTRLVWTPSKKKRCRYRCTQTLPELHDGSCQVNPVQSRHKRTKCTACCTAPLSSSDLPRHLLASLIQDTKKIDNNLDMAAQTSKLMSPGEGSSLQNTIDNKDVVPSRKRPYILYHKSSRGWLVKPLRKRHCLESCPATAPGLSEKQEDNKLFQIDLSEGLENFKYDESSTHDCSCTRNHNEKRCFVTKNIEKSLLLKNDCEKPFVHRNDYDINVCRPIYHKKPLKDIRGKNLSRHLPENSSCSSDYNCGRNKGKFKRNVQSYLCFCRRKRKEKTCSRSVTACLPTGTACTHRELPCSAHETSCSYNETGCLRSEVVCPCRKTACLRNETACPHHRHSCSRQGNASMRMESEDGRRGLASSGIKKACRETSCSCNETGCSRSEAECPCHKMACLRHETACLDHEYSCSRHGNATIRLESECGRRGLACSDITKTCSRPGKECSRRSTTVSRGTTCSRHESACSRNGPSCSRRYESCLRRDKSCTHRDKACSPRKKRRKYDYRYQDGWCDAGIYESDCCKYKRNNLRCAIHRAINRTHRWLYDPCQPDDCEWLCYGTRVNCCASCCRGCGECCRGCGKCCKCFMLCITAVFWVPVVMLVYFLQDVLFNTCL